jgi:DNA-binding cell septation regulator SpoVG
MHLTVEHFAGDRPSFNLNLHTDVGKATFLTIKGCRLMEGAKGTFVSWPATKNDKTGKWWNHCFASDAFNVAVIKAVRESTPAPDTRTVAERRPKPPLADMEDDIPFN